MFTGIVEATGTVLSVEDRATTRRFFVRTPGAWRGSLEPGASVAVDGACLTVLDPRDDGFSVDVIGTTLERTIAGGYAAGHTVNLERGLKLGARLDGHLVQGHVDGVGHLEYDRDDGEFWRMGFRLPPEIAALTIEHGSLTLNGVSLTVSSFAEPDVVEIGVIPHTRGHTNLGALTVGDAVNVEGDLIGKYVGRILASAPRPGPSQSTES